MPSQMPAKYPLSRETLPLNSNNIRQAYDKMPEFLQCGPMQSVAFLLQGVRSHQRMCLHYKEVQRLWGGTAYL